MAKAVSSDDSSDDESEEIIETRDVSESTSTDNSKSEAWVVDVADSTETDSEEDMIEKEEAVVGSDEKTDTEAPQEAEISQEQPKKVCRHLHLQTGVQKYMQQIQSTHFSVTNLAIDLMSLFRKATSKSSKISIDLRLACHSSSSLSKYFSVTISRIGLKKGGKDSSYELKYRLVHMQQVFYSPHILSHSSMYQHQTLL